MSAVVSFRPTKEEEAIIEKTKARIGAKSRTEAVRHLIRKGGSAQGSLADSPMFRYHLPKRFRSKKGVTSREIDESLYGGRG